MSSPHTNIIPFEHFGAVVRRQMRVLRIAGKALAEEFGVREQAVSAWRNGKTRPTDEARIARLAQRLNVSPEELLSDGPSAAPLPQTSSNQQNPDDYWRGVYFAAETMSATVTQLLRQARVASEKPADSSDVETITRFAAAHVPTPPTASQSSRPSTRAANRRTDDHPAPRATESPPRHPP